MAKLSSCTLKALFAVCGHLQDVKLYQPPCASVCKLGSDGSTLVTCHCVEPGDMLTLFPVHAIGTVADDKHTVSPIMSRLFVPGAEDLFIDGAHETRVPGWLGHIAVIDPDESNCVAVPLAGATPLVALISTVRIPSGAEVRRRTSPSSVDESEVLAHATARRYGDEIGELQGYLDMALRAAAQTSEAERQVDPLTLTPPRSHRFHRIHSKYPGIRALREQPDPSVLMVHGFLSADECERLVHKAQPHMSPCVVKNPRTGAIELDPDRTSTAAIVPQNEVPSIVAKLVALAGCSAQQLEALQVLHYTRGQAFLPHTDGFSGATTACGFEQSARLVTIFAYLDDVPSGGETIFNHLGLTIRPEKGTAVVHFPTTEDTFEQDARTEHEGAAAVDDKWLLATWVWAHSRTDETYAEERLRALSADVI